MGSERGAIYSPEAYARGKMLNHSGWAGVLPRGITPSDIDMIFGNGRNFLIVELNSRHADWSILARESYGQYRLSEDKVIQGRGACMAVLAQHAIPAPGVQIDTVKDILAFSLMWYDGDSVAMFSPVPYRGSSWKNFVLWWFNNPGRRPPS